MPPPKQPRPAAATPTLEMAEEGTAGMTRTTQQAAAGSRASTARSPRRQGTMREAFRRLSRAQADPDGQPTANVAAGAGANSLSARHSTHEADGAGGHDQSAHGGGRRPSEESSTQPSFAANNDQPRYTSSDVDYETKYAPDPYGEELSKNARVWSVYNDEVQIADKERVQKLNGTLDALLVFAGLFSAVVTTFVAQSSQALTPDYAQITASLVYELVLMQRAAVSGNPGQVPHSSLSLDSRTHQTSDLWVNALWLISLMFSLLTALVSVLAKQWIQARPALHFDSLAPGSPRDRALVRQYRFLGFERWKVPAIIGILPVLLTIALFFFFAGLTVYVAPMNTALYAVVVSLSGISVVAYAASVTLSIIYPQCAYRTPVSDYVAAACAWLLFLTFGLTYYIFLLITARELFSPSFGTLSEVVDDDLSCRARESSEVKSRRTHLMNDVLEWLATSSFNNSAASVSAQAISALDGILTTDHWQSSNAHWEQISARAILLDTMLRDCGTSIAQVKPLAGRIERLIENTFWQVLFGLDPNQHYETTHKWLNERWDSLHNCRDENVVPLRMHIYIANLQEYRWSDQSNHTVLRRALCAVDSETWPSDLPLRPTVWRHLCYAMWQFENVVPGVSALKPYTELSPTHKDDKYEAEEQDIYEKTAISLDVYADRWQAGTGRDDILRPMKELGDFFLERLAQLEADTARTDRDGTEDDGVKERSRHGGVPSTEAEEGTGDHGDREPAAASRSSTDEDALAAGRASDSGLPSRENAETPVEFDGAGDAAMSARVEGSGDEREGVDVGLPATAPTASPRMQAGEALAEGDGTRDESSKAIIGTVYGAEDEGHSAEDGVRSVERQRSASAGEQETSVVVDEEGATFIASVSVGEVEPPWIGEGPPSTGGGKPLQASGVESSPGEVKSAPSEGERRNLGDDVDRRLYSEPESLLSDDVVGRSPDTSDHQPSAGEETGRSDGGQSCEGPSKDRQPSEVLGSSRV